MTRIALKVPLNPYQPTLSAIKYVCRQVFWCAVSRKSICGSRSSLARTRRTSFSTLWSTSTRSTSCCGPRPSTSLCRSHTSWSTGRRRARRAASRDAASTFATTRPLSPVRILSSCVVGEYCVVCSSPFLRGGLFLVQSWGPGWAQCACCLFFFLPVFYFDFLSTSQEIGSDEHPRKDQFCVECDMKS